MTRKARIAELKARIGELTNEELDELSRLSFEEFDELAALPATAENVAELSGISQILSEVQTEKETRAQAAEELERQRQETIANIERIRNPEGPPSLAAEGEAAEGDDTEAEGEDEEPEEGDGADGGEGDAGEGAEADATAEGQPVPVAAAAVSPPRNVRASAMAARRGRAAPSPAPAARIGRPRVVAAANLRDLVAGQEITDRSVLASAMVEMLTGLDKRDAPSGRHWVARARWDDAYPEERRLGPDPYVNTERINAVCAPQAIAASGGTCLPANVDYSVPTFAVADRPLRDGLPAYQADRGALQYVTPPDIGVPSLQSTPASGLGAATAIWTEATDASPGTATKPVYTVTCGSVQEVYVNAIATRLKFGNMMGRFAPEQIAANTDVAVAVAAREAELELLKQMYSASKQVKATSYLGAARDLLAAADLLSTKYRYSHRMSETQALTAVFPFWAKAMIRADLARELAHDNTNGRDVFAIDDALIEGWFAARNINIIWTLDGLPAGTYGTGGSALKNQFFPLQGTAATIAAWPNVTAGVVQVGWLLYAEGSFQFLDGGRLTLGVVRDSTLDATNDYETFVETFEGIAMRGLEAYQVQSNVKPTGGSAGTVASTSYVE